MDQVAIGTQGELGVEQKQNACLILFVTISVGGGGEKLFVSFAGVRMTRNKKSYCLLREGGGHERKDERPL